MKTIKELIALYRETFFLPDEGIIPLICSIVISNKMAGDAVWLMIIGPSSGGKSELINTMLGVEQNNKPFCYQISTLTPNTLLSGARAGGKETSLLHKIGPAGVILMKDFTSILSMGQEAQIAIMGQMREVYDGYITKETGTGVALQWKGKLNFIGGTTEGIYTIESKFSTLGPRWVSYILQDMTARDRIEITRKALAFAPMIEARRKTIADAFANFVKYKIDTIPQAPVEIEEEFLNDIIEVADFSALARSPSERNYRGELIMSISAELAPRMAKMCMQIARGLIHVNDGVLEPWIKTTVFKTAIDVIPKQKMLALKALLKYKEVTTAGLASDINYPTATVKTWLEDLNVRGICFRNKGDMQGKRGDSWQLDSHYRSVLHKFLGIEQVGELLDSSDSSNGDGPYDPNADTDTAVIISEQSTLMDNQFDSI